MTIFEKLYKDLQKKYGRPSGQWLLWCKRPKNWKEKEEVIIEAILTQRANWKNVELAMANLINAKINSLRKIYEIGFKDKEKFAYLIKPSGFYRAKADYLFNLASFILKNYDRVERMEEENAAKLKKSLLDQKGIGAETADSILLYALEKPVFVIDEYTRRLVKKLNLVKNFSYNFLQDLFEKNLRKDYRLYQDFHALIVIEGKNRK